MKKIITALIVSFLIISSSFAAEKANQNPNQNRSFYQSIKSGWNSFLDALAGKSSRRSANTSTTTTTEKVEVKQTKVTVTTNPPSKSSPKSTQNNGSLYQSIKSGWNSFLDVLTGTK